MWGSLAIGITSTWVRAVHESRNTRIQRLNRASRVIDTVFAALKPTDLSEKDWLELQRISLVLGVKAERLKHTPRKRKK